MKSRKTKAEVVAFTTFLAIVIAALPAFTRPAAAKDVKFTASVNRDQIGINETLQYTLTMENVSGRIPSPKLPKMKDFDVINTQTEQRQTIINGRMSSSFRVIYHLLPKNPGKFTIPPASFSYSGKEYKSNAVEVEVVKGEKKPKQRPPQNLAPTIDPQQRDKGISDNLFFKATVNKRKVVVNEPILLTFGFYRRIQIAGGSIQWPTLSGFWAEDLESAHDVRETIVDGRRYMVEEWKKVIFPTTTGTFTIGEGAIRVNTFGFRDYEVKSEPIKIEVVDFPAENKPDSFNGAVGRFKISSELSAKESSVNEPITLTVKITGVGNVDSIDNIDVDLPPDIDIYESKNTSSTFHAKDYVHGERLFEYTLLPRSPGEYTIPPVSLTYFDYSDDKYKTISTGQMKHTVAGTAVDAAERVQVPRSSVTVLKHEINYIKPAEGKLSARGLLYKNPFYLAAHLLAFLAIGLTTIAKRRKVRLREDVAFARSSRARGFATRKLRKARRLMNEKSQKEFFAEISRALYDYFADKLNTSAGSLVIQDIVERLQEITGNRAPEEDIRKCLDDCDAARFSTEGLSLDVMKETYDRALKVINTVERESKRAD